MLFFSLLSLIVCKPSSKNSKGGANPAVANKTETQSAPTSKCYLNLHDVKMVGTQPHAIISHNLQPGGSYALMKNYDSNNQNAWTMAHQYPADKTSNINNNHMELVMPEDFDKNAHYCVVYTNPNDQKSYSRPFKYTAETGTWAPSRTEEQDNMIAQKVGSNADGKGAKYTNKPLDSESKKGANTKRSSKSSAAGTFCSIFAGLVVLSAILM